MSTQFKLIGQKEVMSLFGFTDHRECLVMSWVHFDPASKLLLHQHSLNDHTDVQKIGAVMTAVHHRLLLLYCSSSFLYLIAFWIYRDLHFTHTWFSKLRKNTSFLFFNKFPIIVVVFALLIDSILTPPFCFH